MSETKMLRRSVDDRMFAGVCGGLGEYLGIDPVIIRVAFAMAFAFAGAGLGVYLVLWLIMPLETAVGV
jgi:phage shock protein PspC (stress-responsive transcriptional regulator)